MSIVSGYQPGHEKDILLLFERVFEKKRSEAHWRWENVENPRGESLITLLKDEQQLRGHLCLHASLFKVGEQYLSAGQRINSMLDGEYQGKGHFEEMFKHLLQNSKKRKLSFMFGFPNQKALRALSKIPHLSKIKDLGEIPRYVKFYDGYKAARHLSKNPWLTPLAGLALQGLLKLKKSRTVENKRVCSIEQFDSRFDKLWYEASKSLPVATVRDTVYLNWRYSRAPRDYKIFAYEEKNGSVSGYLVLLCEAEMSHILDLLALEHRKVLPALLSRADEYCRDKCHTLSCWCLDKGQVSGILKKHGFLRFKSQNRIVCNMIDCPAEQKNLLLENRNWYVMMGDSDYK